jgi:oligopeptidase B
MLLCGAAAGAFGLCLQRASGAWARSPAGWPKITPPGAPRVDNWIDQLGRRRNDAYAWMKYIPPTGTRSLDTLPPMLRTHLTAEMQYASAVLAPLKPAKQQFFDRMMARVPADAAPPPLATEGWRYGSRLVAGTAHPIFIRTAPDGREEVLFAEADRARGHAYYRATEHQPSPDHRYFAWAEDLIGNDRHQICILDTQTGTIRVAVTADAYGYGAVTFSPSSRYLFWIWRDARNRPTRLYRTAVADGEAVLVYEESDPAIFMSVARTAAGGFVALTLAGPDMGEVRLIAADAETAPPRVVRRRARETVYQVNEWAGKLVMLTDADGAIDRKLLSLDPKTFATKAELVPHRPGMPIIAILPFAEALVRLERENGLHRLMLLHEDGSDIALTFDAPAYAIELAANQAYRARQVRITYQTPADPQQSIDVDLATGERKVVGTERLHGYDPAVYRVERIEARAADREMVPLTILSRRDTPAGKPLPLLLTGYGAYGISSEPLFSLPATVLVDAGFRYAIAHVRGGSEKGQRWFLEGRRMKKRNSMTDFIACARHLCEIGYTRPRQIVAWGLSAGGLLVGGALNIEPGLWAGVIAQVPFVDMLNTMSDANHPLVPLFRPDWGDPLADTEAYDYIASISPYENVQAAPYPPVLCTAGLKDDRVPYWEPAKFIAQIRERSTADNPAVLLLDPDSGHQSSGDRDSDFEKAATFWAFAQQCVSP